MYVTLPEAKKNYNLNQTLRIELPHLNEIAFFYLESVVCIYYSSRFARHKF